MNTVSTLPAEGFTVMRMSLDRTRIVRRPLERETVKVAANKIVHTWVASLSLNLFQGFFFWNYDASVKDFKKCSDVSCLKLVVLKGVTTRAKR